MKRIVTILALSFVCVLSVIGFAACGDPPYYGKYHSLNNNEEIIINDKGFMLGDTVYNYEVNDKYLQLTNYSGNTTKWYRHEKDNVISPEVTFNFSTGSIPTRNGVFDATLYNASDRTTYYFDSSGNYKIDIPSMPTLSEAGMYKLENGLLTLIGNKRFTYESTYTRYYIDENYKIHVFAYVKQISLFYNSENDSENETPTTTPTIPDEPSVPTTPTEPNTPTEPVHNYELTYTFNSALEGYIVSGYEGTISGSVEIPSAYKNVSIVSIGDEAFYYCSGLTSITIPDNITSIGHNAFSVCSSLTSVTIGNSVTSIGTATFSGCSSLTSVTIPDSVTSIGGAAFRNCSSLTSVTIPDSVTSIGYGAFENCSGLTSITIPDSVTSIGDYAFSGCSSLTSITIPDSITSIGYFTFSGCSSLTSITIPDSVTSIYTAFDNCKNLKTIYINSAYAVNYADFADTLPEFATDIYILTSIEPTLSVYTIVYEKQDETVLKEGKEYYHYKIKE